jgi:signal transduction histidine kinase
LYVAGRVQCGNPVDESDLVNIEARPATLALDLGQFEADGCPVVLVEPETGRLAWANPAGRAWLGIAAVAGIAGHRLDRAMPALVRLMAFAQERLPAGGRTVELVWWTPGGIESCPCECWAHREAGGETRMLVRVNRTVVPAASNEAPPVAAGVERTAISSRAPARQDSHVLREIARQIRAGTSGRDALPSGVVGDAGEPTARNPTTHASDKPGSGTTHPQSPSHGLSLSDLARLIEAIPVSLAVLRGQMLVHANGTMLDALGFAGMTDLLAAGGLQGLLRGAAEIEPASVVRLHGPEGSVEVGATPILDAAVREGAFLLTAREPPVAVTSSAEAPADSTPSGSESALLSARALAELSHELRTPLTSIIGFAELMRAEKLGALGHDKYKGYAADIRDSAGHALDLVNGLLDRAIREADAERPLERVRLQPADVICSVIASLQPMADAAGLGLSAPLVQSLPELLADRMSLRQMLLNLVTNAIKHAERGGAVWVTAATAADGGMVLRVQDTGRGISDADIAAALNPEPSKPHPKRPPGSSGIGLPLTAGLARANGGRLALERVEGGGTAALLVFPRELVVRG